MQNRPETEKTKSKLVVHTRVIPISPETQPPEDAQEEVRWKPLPHPKARQKRRMLKGIERAKQSGANPKQGLTMGEKLLRNGAIACALLLSVMALQNLDQPWSQQATEGIKRVVSMKIDLDETLGKLNFVRNLVPETALVFWNASARDILETPVAGDLVHPYDDQQPWLEYSCAASQQVYAAAAGEVNTVGQGAQGDWIVSLTHEDGSETVYAYLGQAIVKKGQSVPAGGQLGITGPQQQSRLYFELRVDGAPSDPTSRMKDQVSQ